MQAGTPGRLGMAGKTTYERATSTSARLQPVYFDYDKSHLRSYVLKAMAHNVAWLKANPKVKVRIECN